LFPECPPPESQAPLCKATPIARSCLRRHKAQPAVPSRQQFVYPSFADPRDSSFPQAVSSSNPTTLGREIQPAGCLGHTESQPDQRAPSPSDWYPGRGPSLQLSSL